MKLHHLLLMGKMLKKYKFVFKASFFSNKRLFTSIPGVLHQKEEKSSGGVKPDASHLIFRLRASN